MENTMSRRRLLLISFVALLFLGSWLTLRYITSFHSVTITYKNTEKVTIYHTPDQHNQNDNKHESITTITQSGQKVKLKKGSDYIAEFTGVAGYDSGTALVRDGQKELSIDPHFSQEKLREILNDEMPSIRLTLSSKYSNMNLYTASEEKLYLWGEWYGATLKYTGDDIFNSDTLRVVLKKENDVWIIKTDPPNISLSKFSYPDIPEEILRDVNNFLK